MPGGKLGIHVDFNKHKDYGLYRRWNLLYPNKDWKENYGGHLELWDRKMARCEAKVLPVFNRVMTFGTMDYAYHGHLDPLRCPEHMTRKSLALDYFSNVCQRKKSPASIPRRSRLEPSENLTRL